MNKLDTLKEAVEDIKHTKWVIVGSVGAAVIIGFIWMIMMKMCAGPITWAMILIFIGAMALGTWIVYQKSREK